MEFWGVEVKAGEKLKVTPEADTLIHLSQAALGEYKSKGNEYVPLYLTVTNKKFVLGTLSTENFPQFAFDVVFKREFELSHNWKSGSVFFTGYKSAMPEEEFSDLDSDEEGDEEEEDIPMAEAENGGVQPKAEDAKPVAKKAKLIEPEKPKKAEVEESDKDDESDEDGDESDEEDDSEEDGNEQEDDSDEEDDSVSDYEETPNKAPPSKKRPNDAPAKTPEPAKKAKVSTSEKSDVKKDVNTPKQAGKNHQTPKSGGQFSCKPCNKSFGSEAALQSHTKAKHSGK